MRTLDLFAGAGGWDIAARHLGHDVERVEIWTPANATAALAGMTTVHEDVTTFHTTPGAYLMHIASPSCKKYSAAGDGAGRRALDQVLHGVHEYRHGRPMSWSAAVELVGDADAALTLEPLRIALEGEPTYITWEQVPAVMPIWDACADVLRERGYSVVTGILNAEQYGVPQTRRRAVLMARRDGQDTRLPVPTHSRFHVRDPKRLDAGVKSWVSMAEALGWGMTEHLAKATVRTDDQPAPTIMGGNSWGERQWVQRSNYSAPGQPGQTAAERGRTTRDLDQPSIAVTGKSFQWAGGPDPATSAGIRVAPDEVACLQTFPADHRFVGNKGEVFQQIGNAVPPLLAEAIISTLTA